jgi:hypothetical protein
MSVHPIVLATIRKHLAEAELRLAVLEAKREEVPATAGTHVQASRLARQIKQAQSQRTSWASVEREASE